MQTKSKIGVGITTYESEHYLEALYNSLPHGRIDELVIVNGGAPYIGDYDKADWIQHRSNHYPSVCRNDCMRYLLARDCEHIFIIEDDMIIKRADIFDKYIETSQNSGIKYLCFTSTSWGSGAPGSRTPRLTVDYPDTQVCLYPNMCNEFTYHHRSTAKLYDESFRYVFDIDSAYRYAQDRIGAPFWWFADIKNSDDYIMNNPETQSRINAGGERDQKVDKEWARWTEKHSSRVQDVPVLSQEQVVQHLLEIYHENRNSN